MKDWAEEKNWHPAANAFSLLAEDSADFKCLIEDIRSQGLNNPITIYEGKLLDGRNRARACKLLGILPDTTQWIPKQGQTPESWSMSQNVVRRHLTIDQRKIGQDELRGYTLFKKLREEYREFEEKYKESWRQVKEGTKSLAAHIRYMDWVKGGSQPDTTDMTLATAAQTFLRLVGFERASKMNKETRKQTTDLPVLDESWAVVQEGVYGFTSNLHNES